MWNIKPSVALTNGIHCKNIGSQATNSDEVIERSCNATERWGGRHTFATTTSRPPKRETQDTVGFSTGSSENTRQKIISTKSTKNSKGNNQVYLHIKQCKQTTAIAVITLEKTS